LSLAPYFFVKEPNSIIILLLYIKKVNACLGIINFLKEKDRLEFAYECNKLADGLWFLGSHCLGPNCQRRGKGEKTLVL